MFSLVLIVFLLPTAADAVAVGAEPARLIASEWIAKAQSRNLSKRRMWHILLRYQEGLFGGYESEADGRNFFLSAEGKHDPKAELEATLRQMLSPTVDEGQKLHPQCRFPARFKWLQAELAEDAATLPPQACPNLAHYLKTMQAKRVVLVFASAYLNAPPSMFGHTFIRFDHVDHPDTLMLSNIINFAANPTTQNPILYSLLGVFGGFQANFAGMPYYAKIREYSDMESRDLWEYELDLSADQIDWMLRLSWDLDQTHFDYFFFRENCSYHVLDLLQIAFPQMDTDDYLSLVSLPTDTIKLVLQQQKTVKPPVFRPAHVTKMDSRRRALNRAELKVATGLADRGLSEDFDALKYFSPDRQAWVLDAAHDRFKYETGFGDRKIGEQRQADERLELRLLKARRDISQPETEPTFNPGEGPHVGHGGRRIGWGIGSRLDGRIFGEFWWRRSFHDILDRQSGFVPDSHLEMVGVRLRLQPQHYLSDGQPAQGLLLERLDLLKIASVFPMTPWVNPLSWRANVHYSRVADQECYTWACTAFTVEGGPGVALATELLGKERYYAFGEVHLSVGPAFDHYGRVSASASAGVLWEPMSFWRMQAETSVFIDFPFPADSHAYRFKVFGASQWSFGQDLAMRIQLSHERSSLEGMLVMFFYH
jgi:hypothetical protein